MGKIDDPRGDIRRFKNARRRVREAIEQGDIPGADGEELLAFGDHRRGEGAPSTAHSQMENCRKAAKKAAGVGLPSLIEWDERTLNRFMVRMEDGEFPEEYLNPYSDDGSWAEGTRRNVKQHLKNFFGFLGREWAGDVYIGAPPQGSVEREDLLTQDELTAMWEAAEHPRDEVLLALPLVTWQRNAALRAFRVGDVHLPPEGRTGYITLNEDALGRKDAAGKRPLTWATGPIKRWIAKHPARDGTDFAAAPLLCVITDAGNAVKGAPLANTESYNRRLRTLAERAGLDRDRWIQSEGRKERTLRAHLLRYTAATRAAVSDEYSEATIKKWAGWTQDSPQLRRYIQLVEEDVLAAANEAHGIESELPLRPEFSKCPSCGGPVEEWHRACPACTGLLTDEAWVLREAAEGINEDATEAAIDATDAEEIEAHQAVRETTANQDALAARVAQLEAKLEALDEG